jgi:FdrA protein
MDIRFLVKASQYFDSVSLMNVARDLRAMPGIDDAALVMGTEANKGLLEGVGPLSPDAQAATLSDLIVMVKGEPDALGPALAEAEKLLAHRPSASTSTSSATTSRWRTRWRSSATPPSTACC